MSVAGVSGGGCRRIGSLAGEAPSPLAPRPRIGLVLGSGGVVGAAWMTGALHAVQRHLPVPLGDVNMIVGTSAGSVLAAALRCGLTLDELTALQRGEPMPALREAGLRDLDDGPLPPRPHLRAGSPRLILTTLRAPHTIHPSVWASAWLPRGRGRHEALHATVAALDGRTGRPGSWADGRTWIVAVDFSTGRRVMFGRPGAPQVPLADAVVASCSIPGWYEPPSSTAVTTWTAACARPRHCGHWPRPAWTRSTSWPPWPAWCRAARRARPSGWNAGCGG